jgi:hypothetical protein
MNSPEIKAFIRENSFLFWYSPEEKKEVIGPEFLVETILNYGDINAVHKLFKLMGIKKVAEVFFYSINLNQRRRSTFMNQLSIFLRCFSNDMHPEIFSKSKVTSYFRSSHSGSGGTNSGTGGLISGSLGTISVVLEGR